MKVAFVFAHPFSESMGSVVRVRELALSLGTMGVEVYICTPYERSFDLSCHVHVISTSQIINDLRLAKPLYKLTKLVYYNKAFPRLFPFFDFQSNTLVAGAIKSFAKLLIENGIDVIQVEQDAALPIGIGLKKATGLPLISDLHNITSEELVATGLLDQRSSRFHDLQLLIRSHLLEK